LKWLKKTNKFTGEPELTLLSLMYEIKIIVMYEDMVQEYEPPEGVTIKATARLWYNGQYDEGGHYMYLVPDAPAVKSESDLYAPL